MNRIWIAGASGRVGTALKERLNAVENELLCTDVTDVDITDAKGIESYAVMCRPNIIINCASIASAEKCEEDPDKAYKVNVLGTRNLAVHAARSGAKFVQMSTDDVFSGKINEPYNEFDMPFPTSVYGRTKRAAEEIVERMVVKHFIIRSAWVYGIGEDYVDQVCRKLEQGDPIEANVNQLSVPTAAGDIASVINELIQTEEYGTYHVVPQGSCTRYEFAKEIARIKGYPAEKVVPVEGPNINTLLDAMMMRLNNMKPLGDWRKALERFIEETGGIA